MKLRDIITENNVQWMVYKVSSPRTDQVYYGYAQGSSLEDCKRVFLIGAQRNNAPDRGDGKMLLAAKEDVDSLKFELIDVSADEIEAFTARNDNRASDVASITGPTQFPGNVYKRALELHPDRVAKWKMDTQLNKMTARESMSAEGQAAGSKLSFAQVKELVAQRPDIKAELTKDLDALMYPQFIAKYFQGQ